MKWIWAAFFVFSLAGCGNQVASMEQATAAAIAEVSPQRWKELARQRIYFAHKSVGYDIVEGINDLVQAYPDINLNVVETRNSADFDKPVLAHAENGLNGDPSGKIAAFQEAINRELGAKLDMAFVKLCWSDFTADTDVPKLFAEYRDRMAVLKTAHPDVTFIHVTVPLTLVQSGPKALVKRALGRPVFGFGENITRNQFNELMLDEYQGKEPVFDLAAWESTQPDGSRRQYTAEGRTYFELIPEYTPDSGHLNLQGRRWVAAKLLAFLASLPSTSASD